MSQFQQALERYLTHEQIVKIQQTRVGIAGAGGLGSNCAQMLVRSGFEKFTIVDFDTIDYSNLNRQFYFFNQVGRNKVEVLRDNLRQINPDLEIEIMVERISEANINGLFDHCDIVVEAFDKSEFKKMIVETYLHSGKFLVAASGLAGWGDSDRIRVHRIRDNFYVIGDRVTGIGPDCPPLAPCVHIAAAKQADVIVSHVLGSMKGE